MKKIVTDKIPKSQTQKVNAQTVLQNVPVGAKLEELGTLALIRFGSETILRAAILDEISGYLGREHYEHSSTEPPRSTA